jgi:hypothetical protein
LAARKTGARVHLCGLSNLEGINQDGALCVAWRHEITRDVACVICICRIKYLFLKKFSVPLAPIRLHFVSPPWP